MFGYYTHTNHICFHSIFNNKSLIGGQTFIIIEISKMFFEIDENWPDMVIECTEF